MQVAFDVLPLIGSQMTGIAYCAAGQIRAMAEAHPEDQYWLQFFSRKDHHIKTERLAPYIRPNCKPHYAQASGYVYRLASNFLPLPYQHYFGSRAQVTHFFNYIVPPGVAGKTVVTVHDMVYKAFPETVRGRTRYMLETGLKRSMQRADCIVTDSIFSKKEILRYFPQVREKLHVVYCGTDMKKFHPVSDPAQLDAVRAKYKLPQDYFLYLGTVEPRKNLERLIEAYGAYSSSRRDVPHLVLAGGKGWLDSGIYDKVQTLHLDGRVHFPGYIDDSDLCALLCSALAFLFPSIYEGFGLPPLEAMACGVPVLTARAASLPEVVGDAALLADPYRTDALAEGMAKLADSDSLRRTLREKGLERAQAFTWEKSAEKLHRIYAALCREAGQS